MASDVPTFIATFQQFCDDLEGTFPEFSVALKDLRILSEAEALSHFRATWRPHLLAIATRDASVFTEAGFDMLRGVKITGRLWKEVDGETHKAIWNYLSSLALLSAAASDATDADSFWDEAEFKKGMEEMIRGLKEATQGAGGAAGAAAGAFGFGGTDSPFAAMGGLFDKLRDMASTFAKTAEEGGAKGDGASSKPEFKMPERLFKGHIAKMAKELAEEFKPEDFGISPDMLETQDPAKIFDYLQEIFTKKPEMLMAAAQRIARKIQAKFQRGEISRDVILSEIEELMKEFSENEAFTSLFGQLGEMLQFSAKATGNEGSERLRQARDRLRKKAAQKDTKKETALVPANMAAAARADAMAAALLAEEDAGKKKKKPGAGGSR